MYQKSASKLFLDSADPAEALTADQLLKKAGFPGVEGVTTNPSLISSLYKKNQNSDISLLDFYRQTVQEIAKTVTGPISVQVIAEMDTKADEMLTQAYVYQKWIPNAVVKFPCIPEGLKAAEIYCQRGPVNMTLVFTQSQAAAVYVATKNTKYPVFLSPFVGRLDDQGLNGMDITANILKMYELFENNQVQVLTASIRGLDHLLYAFMLRSHIVSAPYKVYKLWTEGGFTFPDDKYQYITSLNQIPYENLTVKGNWQDYNMSHDLTSSGVMKFHQDWQEVNQSYNRDILK